MKQSRMTLRQAVERYSDEIAERLYDGWAVDCDALVAIAWRVESGRAQAATAGNVGVVVLREGQSLVLEYV